MDRTLTTTGIGTAVGVPDALRVGASVVARETTASDALTSVASGVAALVESAERFTDAQRISSAGLSVYSRQTETGELAGYEARHTVTIHVRGLERAGEFVSALGELGGRALIDHVAPVIDDAAPLEAVARRHAFADALTKAEELAFLAGVPLGRVVRIEEGNGVVEPRPMFMKAAAMPIAAGEQSVSAQVTVTWAID